MKNSIKLLSILLTVAAMSFTSCKKDDCDDGPSPDTKDCNTELIFMDHAMCSGDWFKTTTGEYLEVYGYPDASKLRKGDKVKFGYRDYDNSNLIECMAISPFEMWLGKNNHKYRTVKANKACFKDKEEPKGCDNELECVDLGICGGVWFKDKNSKYLEVYDYPKRSSLKVGDVVKFGYEAHTPSGYTCAALTQWEVEFLESGHPYKKVKAKKECFGGNEEPTRCDTKVTYWKKDFCSGDLLKTEDGKLLRAFGLELTDREYKEGDQFRISYKSKVIKNDCQYIRQPDEIGEPVDITCQTEASTKE